METAIVVGASTTRPGLTTWVTAIVLGVIGLCAWSSAVALVISKPTANQRFAAGPDYATDVLGDPWDFSNPEDVGLDPEETIGWTNFSLNGGLAGGTTLHNDAGLSLLYSGRFDTVNTGRTGLRYPIDSSKYKKISYRMYSGVAGQLPQHYWFHSPWNDPADAHPPRNFGVQFGFTTVQGYRMYALNLTLNPEPGSIPWTQGVVRGLRIDPNINASGHEVFYDWVRLTAADNEPGSAMMSVEWLSDIGAPILATIDVLDANQTVLPLGSNLISPFVWNYGVLPPGAYQLRITPIVGAPATVNFSVNNPPLIKVTEPNETGGDDYATVVLGNAWDMNSAADIQTTPTDNIKNLSFAGGLLNATNTNSDPNITLLNQNNNATPIDSSKYRFLTYTFQIDGQYDLGGGSVARIIWDSSQVFAGATATTTKDIVVWSGMNSYTIDLGSLTTAPSGSTVSPIGGIEPNEGAPQLWTAAPKRQLRFDPHEFTVERTFHIDNVKLAAMAQAKNNQFTIHFAGADADAGDNAFVDLYYDVDQNPTNGKTLIASNLPIASAQHVWNTTGVPAGVYWIYAEARDGIDTRGVYSTGQVKVTGPPLPSGLLDIDASIPSTKYDSLTDGLMILRYLFGLIGPAITGNALGATATRTEPDDIKTYLDGIRGRLDIDGNGNSEALTDGLLIIRYMFGLRGNTLIQDAVGTGATRKTSAEIEAQIQTLMP